MDLHQNRWKSFLSAVGVGIIFLVMLVGCGGGDLSGFRVSGVYISQPESPTYESSITLLGSIGITTDYDNEYSRTVTVTWRNDLTGESGSEERLFTRECYIVIVLFIPLPKCNSYGNSSLSIPMSLAVGNNTITVTADGKRASVSVIRKAIDENALPYVETLPGIQIGSYEAKLPGRVNPHNWSIEYWFEYSTDSNLSSAVTTSHKSLSGIDDVDVFEIISNLIVNTTYYYRIIASNKYGTVQGEIQSFITLAPAKPVVITLGMTPLTNETATISGVVNSNGEAINAWFEWGTDSTLSMNISTAQINIPFGSAATTINEVLVSLSTGTVYYYRVVAVNNVGTSNGEILSFQTFPPTAITSPAMQLFPRESTLSGSVNPNGSETTTWFELGFDPDFAAYVTTSPVMSPGAGEALVSVDQLFEQLSTGTKYYYRLSASNIWGTVQGETLSFTTPLVGDTSWAKIYHPYIGSIPQDLPRITSIEQTTDNGYIMVAPANSDYRSWIMKTNVEGGMEWSKGVDSTTMSDPISYPYNYRPSASIIKQISDGRFIVGGEVQIKPRENSGAQSIWISELDENGTIVWQKTYGKYLPQWQSLVDIEVLPDGYIVISTQSSEEYGLWVSKLDQSGGIVWQYFYDLAYGLNPIVADIEVANDGYVIGGGINGGPGIGPIWILKLDLDGNIIWHKTYGGSEPGSSGGYISVSVDGITVAGTKYLDDGSSDIWVLNLANDGSINWQNTYGGAGNEGAAEIHSTEDGGFILSGVTNSFQTNTGGWLLKLSNTGSIEWQKKLLVGNRIGSVREVSGGGYITSTAITDPYPPYDITLIKTNIGGSCLPLDFDTTAIPVATNVVALPNASTRMPADFIEYTSDTIENDTDVAIEQIAP